MNISAVLSTLGLPTIRGYKPKFNVQNAIYDAIDRYLTANPKKRCTARRFVSAVSFC